MAFKICNLSFHLLWGKKNDLKILEMVEGKKRGEIVPKKIARLKTIPHLLKFNVVFYIKPFMFYSQRHFQTFYRRVIETMQCHEGQDYKEILST